MITNTKNPAEKWKNTYFFPISKKNSFSKSAYSKNFAEKRDIFRIFFKSKNFAKNASNEPHWSSVRQKLVIVMIFEAGHFLGGKGGGGFVSKQDSVWHRYEAQSMRCWLKFLGKIKFDENVYFVLILTLAEVQWLRRKYEKSTEQPLHFSES